MLLATTIAEASLGDDPSQDMVARTSVSMGIIATTTGDLATAMCRFREAMEAFEKIGNERWLSGVRTNLGFVLLETGAFEQSVVELTAALAVSERLGLAYSAALARQNLGMALGYLNRFDEARTVETAAVISTCAAPPGGPGPESSSSPM